jgi:hypothetical protein
MEVAEASTAMAQAIARLGQNGGADDEELTRAILENQRIVIDSISESLGLPRP